MLDMPNIVTAVAIISGIVGTATFVPTTLAWLEARRQRQLTEKVAPAGAGARTAVRDSVWRCGIYDYPPLGQWSAGLGADPTGPLPELGRQIGFELGKAIKFEFFSYDGFYAEDDALPDMVVGMFETKKRSERMVFSRPVYEIGLQGICRTDQKGDVLAGLREGQLKAAVYKGEVGWEFLRDELPDAVATHRFVEVAGGHQMDTMIYLSEGRYDVVLMDSLSCFNFLRQKSNENRFRLAFEEPLKKYPTCLALNKRHGALLGSLNEAILKIRNSKEYLRSESAALQGYEKVIERRGLRASA